MIVNWYSLRYGIGEGYGHAAERFILGLEEVGLDVRCQSGMELAGETMIGHVLAKPFVPGDVRIIFAAPRWKIDWAPLSPDQATLGMTMWEDSALPPFWAEHFATVDAVAAPSRFCQGMFQPACSHPVLYVPLGVDHSFYAYRPHRYEDHEVFTVLHGATRLDDARKGGREAVAAFLEAFEDDPMVRLILRGQYGDLDVPPDPRIERHIGYLTEIEKREMLYSSHVYLYPSFGEGFGLTPLEAIATGLPTICSLNTGMLDYADLIDAVECDPAMSHNITPTIPSTNGHWQKPRHGEIVGLLRSIRTNYRLAAHRASQRASLLRSRWGYDKAVHALLAAIGVARCRRDARLSQRTI